MKRLDRCPYYDKLAKDINIPAIDLITIFRYLARKHSLGLPINRPSFFYRYNKKLILTHLAKHYPNDLSITTYEIIQNDLHRYLSDSNKSFIKYCEITGYERRKYNIIPENL